MIIEIPQKQAMEIIRMNMHDPQKQVVIHARGKWFDCRSAAKKQIVS